MMFSHNIYSQIKFGVSFLIETNFNNTNKLERRYQNVLLFMFCFIIQEKLIWLFRSLPTLGT